MMFKVAGLIAAVAMSGSMALATDLTLTCTVNGQSDADVSPNMMVTYTITGELSNDPNEGLALVGFDLEFTGGALSKADVPTSVNMINFDRPEGITNPGVNGFGGTIIGNNLVQVGGGQNTILNTMGNAPFPIGTVIADVAKNGFPEVIVTGSLMIPSAVPGGPYDLNITNAFANVIKAGETGMPFWATELAGTVNVVKCTLTVVSCVAVIANADPADNTIDGREPHAITTMSPGESFSTITFDICTAMTEVAGNFTVTETGGTGLAPTIVPPITVVDADTVTLTLSEAIEAGAWTTITHTGGSNTCVGNLPGNVNNDLISDANDATTLVAVLNGGASTLTQADANRSGVINAEDLTHLMNLLNGAGMFIPWLNEMLPLSPC